MIIGETGSKGGTELLGIAGNAYDEVLVARMQQRRWECSIQKEQMQPRRGKRPRLKLAPERHGPNFSPSSRTLQPASIYQTTGNLVAGQPTINLLSATCTGSTCSGYDLPAFNCTGECQGLRLGYTESPVFVDDWGGTDWTTWYTFPDGPLYLPLDQLGSYTVPDRWARGSFRYLTLSLGPDTSSNTSVEFSFTSLRFTAAPNIEDESEIGAYTGYFESSDDLLNKIWNAGVYTLQLNTMSANTSLNISYFLDGNGWANDWTSTSLNSTDVFIADGAKRNRNPWSADFSIFFRSALVSQNYGNMRAARNGIQANFVLQDQNASSETYGYFPYAGSPLGDAFLSIPELGFPLYSSDTYQCWAILSLMEYFLATGDHEWVEKYWPQVVLGINATFPFVNPATGLFNGTRTVDWGRDGQGGENLGLNAIYYHTLMIAAMLAPHFQGDVDTTNWTSTAVRAKQSLNDLLWDEKAGLFKDNTTTAGAQVHPQDGNSFAVRYNLTLSSDQNVRIADALSQRWTSFGAPSAELRGYISPFATSHEVFAQFDARPGEPGPALDLIRTQWGFMLHEFSNETCIEGYGADGSLAYGFYGDAPAFISLAHAFSTGPTYALPTYVAGLRTVKGMDVREDEESNWVWVPGVFGSGLSWVKSGYQAPNERGFDVEWMVDEKKFSGSITTPAEERGTIYVPILEGEGESECKEHSAGRLFVNGIEIRSPARDGSGNYFRLDVLFSGIYLLLVRVTAGDEAPIRNLHPPPDSSLEVAHHGEATRIRDECMDMSELTEPSIVVSVFAIVILSTIGALFKSHSHTMMGSTGDPEDGGAVAGAVFGAVFIYIGFFVFCGFQALLHYRESRRGAISLS
ncbi:Six-hairpin glycosidase-like protein [Lophiotrema nucula]|uniref:Six-hairpin glycosidase-like protein n=1 Tax=Lophiotrema nucula TaxID=690887 RepID=A0A6A5Z5W2_9PLEO|nr:Six-hairpin glycosidase-like protein [Lophiotrema nucula]